MFHVENRAKDFGERWNQVEEIYQELRDEAESAIQSYDEMECMYGEARWDLFEAEGRIAELEEEIRVLQQSLQQYTVKAAVI
ncbi:MAG: hypothetical protein IJ231_09080 [Clostridia bacterium]|nr:hypothetical protein [Clostridia bacterium]